MQKEHFLLSEVAREVQRKPYQITYLISTGLIEEPELRIANKRLFTKQDIERIKHVFQGREAHG